MDLRSTLQKHPTSSIPPLDPSHCKWAIIDLRYYETHFFPAPSRSIPFQMPLQMSNHKSLFHSCKLLIHALYLGLGFSSSSKLGGTNATPYDTFVSLPSVSSPQTMSQQRLATQYQQLAKHLWSCLHHDHELWKLIPGSTREIHENNSCRRSSWKCCKHNWTGQGKNCWSMIYNLHMYKAWNSV